MNASLNLNGSASANVSGNARGNVTAAAIVVVTAAVTVEHAAGPQSAVGTVQGIVMTIARGQDAGHAHDHPRLLKTSRKKI